MPLGLAAAITLATTAAPQGQGRRGRLALGGHYTVGLYGNERGSIREVQLEKGETRLEGFIGITSDSIRVFSGITMGLELPEGIELSGAIVWKPIGGLLEQGLLLDGGIEVGFGNDCQTQQPLAPAMLGKIRFTVAPEFREGEIRVVGHERYDLGVELCEGDSRKPIARPLHLSVQRKMGFWDRLKDIFHH
jgi:hypothetical protein